jgi:hypothetical protein
MNEATMQTELESLRAENVKLKNKEKSLSLKVSEKGGVSLYGLGRFPVTLYKSQWLRILTITDAIEAFIRENDSKLTESTTGNIQGNTSANCANETGTNESAE